MDQVGTASDLTATSRQAGAAPVGRLVLALLPPALRRRGLAAVAALADWPAIVGPELAARCRPIDLRFPRGEKGGVLELWASAATALELQHSAPVLIERINGFLGFRAVSRILIRQRPLASMAIAEPVPQPASSPDVEAAIAAATASLAHEELRAALAALGRRLLAPAFGKRERR